MILNMRSLSLMALVTCGLFTVDAEEKRALSIDAVAAHANPSKVEILFKIQAKRAFTVDTAELPWLTPLSLTFMVVPVGSGEALRRVYTLNSPVFGKTTFKTGWEKQGTIDLETFFPDIVGSLAK